MSHPAWWPLAACRGDGAASWVSNGSVAQLTRLRAICAGCPVSGACLQDALGMSEQMRGAGLVRLGVVGHRPWRAVAALVAELEPTSAEDWATLGAWVCDGDIGRAAPDELLEHNDAVPVGVPARLGVRVAAA